MKRTYLPYSLFLILLVTVPDRAQFMDRADRSKEDGRLEGIVVTQEGLPVSDAIVYIFTLGRSPTTRTDQTGHFSFSGLSVGDHNLIAYKESDGYPNLAWSFYSETYGRKGAQIVRITSSQAETRTTIRLGPKAARLLISTIDTESKQPIKDASITMNYKAAPKTLLRSGSNRPDGFDVLIPPEVPVEIAISAPGYQTFHFEQRGQDFIKLSSGSEKRLTVELHR